MSLRSRLRLLLILPLILSGSAPGGQAAVKPQESSPPVASTNPPEAEETPIEYRIGVMGGLGFAPPEEEYDYTRRIVTAVESEVNWGYVGAEADGYYGFGVSQSTNAGTGEKQDAVDQYGAFGNVKLQSPFWTGPIRWSPKVGIGYGMMSVDEEEEGGLHTNLQGPYFITGIEFEHRKKMIFDFDYSFSLSATSGFPAPAGTTDSASFYRLRVGAFYRTDDHILVGVRVIRHGLNLPVSSNDNFNESQMEFLGAILFEL
jgi:hypothetical protein